MHNHFTTTLFVYRKHLYTTTLCQQHPFYARYLVPRHICPSVNLAEKALLIDRDSKGRLYLASVTDVEARAHDMLLSDPLVSDRWSAPCKL